VQIEALKEVGVTEVVLAINYRPEVKEEEEEIIHL
jgi:NDP-sugar pyrophosphorylase family protein